MGSVSDCSPDPTQTLKWGRPPIIARKCLQPVSLTKPLGATPCLSEPPRPYGVATRSRVPLPRFAAGRPPTEITRSLPPTLICTHAHSRNGKEVVAWPTHFSATDPIVSYALTGL